MNNEVCIHGNPFDGECLECDQIWERLYEEEQGYSVRELESQIRIRDKVINSMPLCPDHRDKFHGKPCPACECERLEAENERLRDGYDELLKWAKAYPINIFPEPDFKKAHQVLKENGMTLDAISASNMRHVITGVEKIIKQALKDTESV